MKGEKSSFISVLGDNPMTRLWDFLLLTRGLYDYSLSQIAENSGISWDTLHRLLPALIKKRIVKQTRTISRAKMYMLNEENETVKTMISVYNMINGKAVEARFTKKPILLRA